MARFAFINRVGGMSEAGREPGSFIMAVAALSRIVVFISCMTRFAVSQTNMVKIVLEPAVGVGMTGVAGAEIMFCRAGMAIFAISVSGMVEYKYFPIFGVCMTIHAGPMGIVI